MSIRAHRGGLTSNKWYGDPVDCRLEIYENQHISIRFNISSKGGGETDISVEITPRSFKKIFETMIALDVNKTLKAMTSSFILHPPAFESLAKAMMKAAPKETIEAFSAALSEYSDAL